MLINFPSQVAMFFPEIASIHDCSDSCGVEQMMSPSGCWQYVCNVLLALKQGYSEPQEPLRCELLSSTPQYIDVRLKNLMPRALVF